MPRRCFAALAFHNPSLAACCPMPPVRRLHTLDVVSNHVIGQGPQSSPCPLPGVGWLLDLMSDGTMSDVDDRQTTKHEIRVQASSHA